MRAVVLKDFKSNALTVEEVPVPSLKPGQVLVKIAASPINPSDLVFLRNQYGIKKALPVIPGFEGAGTVVSSQGSLYGRWLVGKRVACHAPEDGNGTWADYMAVSAGSVIPLCADVSLEQAASLMVNPLTAWALVSIAAQSGKGAFIQTAAASALGRMMDRLARRRGLVCINIVRRREQVELLKKEGAIHVLDSSQPGWQEQLKVLSDRHQVQIAFDAVGGLLSSQIAQAMGHGSRILVYGALAGENFQMDPASLIFEGKHLEGFWLPVWLKKRSFLQNMKMASEVQKLLASDLRTDVQSRFSLDQINDAIALYKEKRTDGKVLLIPTLR